MLTFITLMALPVLVLWLNRNVQRSSSTTNIGYIEPIERNNVGENDADSRAHSPSGGMLIPEIVTQLFVTSDTNGDGHLSLSELEREFLTNFDHGGDGHVHQHEFVKQWQHNYRESHSVSIHVFQHFDFDHDGDVTQSDIQHIFNLLDHHPQDHNLSQGEFHHLMFYIYGRLPEIAST